MLIRKMLYDFLFKCNKQYSFFNLEVNYFDACHLNSKQKPCNRREIYLQTGLK